MRRGEREDETKDEPRDERQDRTLLQGVLSHPVNYYLEAPFGVRTRARVCMQQEMEAVILRFIFLSCCRRALSHFTVLMSSVLMTIMMMKVDRKSCDSPPANHSA